MILKYLLMIPSLLCVVPICNLVNKFTGDKELARKTGHTLEHFILLFGCIVIFEGTVHSVFLPFLYSIVATILMHLKVKQLDFLERDNGNTNRCCTLFAGGAFMLLSILTLIDTRFKVPFILGVFALNFGDSAAALIGKRFGKYSMKFKNGKSAIGSLAFIIATFISINILMLCIGFEVVLWKLLVLSIVGAFMEFFSDDLDNFLIPITVGFLAFVLLF